MLFVMAEATWKIGCELTDITIFQKCRRAELWTLPEQDVDKTVAVLVFWGALTNIGYHSNDTLNIRGDLVDNLCHDCDFLHSSSRNALQYV